MDRFWFFTWRTYGTWLPGHAGFVGYYHTPDGRRVSDNIPGEPASEPIPALERHAASLLKTPPVILNSSQADALVAMFQTHAAHRGWRLDAAAVMPNHVHLVFGVPGDPNPDRMLADWKAYASRALNALAGWPPPAPRPTWWERDGSTRVVRTAARLAAAVRYVRDQESPLLVWLSEDARASLAEFSDEVWANPERERGG